MATLQKQAIDALIVALNTARPATVPEATRLRQVQNERESLPAISVYPGNETVKPATNRPGPLAQRTALLVVECRVAGDEPDVLLDPLLAWATAAVTTAESTLWHDVQEVETRFQFTIGEVPMGLAQVLFLINYQTRRTSREAAA